MKKGRGGRKKERVKREGGGDRKSLNDRKVEEISEGVEGIMKRVVRVIDDGGMK